MYKGETKFCEKVYPELIFSGEGRIFFFLSSFKFTTKLTGRYGNSLPSYASGEGNGNPLQYSCLENPMAGGACWAAVHGVPASRTRLSELTCTFMHWRTKWQPTPVFLPGESQGWGNLVGCRIWGRTRLKQLSSSSCTCISSVQLLSSV